MHLLKFGSALVCLLILQIGAVENSEEEARRCPDDSLPCDSGECVRREEWCDNQKNCADESDERYCLKKKWYNTDPNRCEKTHFLCDDGRCVPRVAKCDDRSDCKDGSDEHHCGLTAYDEYDDHTYTESAATIQTETTITETYSESNGLENEDLHFTTTTTHAPTETFTQDAPLSSPVVNFYAKRMEQESVLTDLQYPTSTITLETAPVPERHPNQGIRQIITTSRPSPPTASPTRTYKERRYHDPSLTPVPVSSRHSDSRRRLDSSLTPTVHPPRSYDSGHYYVQPHSTRSYVAGQHPNLPQTQRTSAYDSRIDPNHTQPPRNYDPRRRPPYQYQTQPTRPYDSRRDPNEYQTHPTRSYDTRRDSNQYPTQPTRPYDSRRDPYQFHTQPTRPDDSRRPPSVPTRQPQYPYPANLTQLSRHHYTREIRRIYLDQEHYYDGYYDQNGHFVVLPTNQRHQPYRDPQPDVSRRNGQAPELPSEMPAVFTRQLKAPSRFYFAKNYTRIYGEDNVSYLRRGREWILSIQNLTGGWGKETPRALIALSLINNSFVNGTHDNDMMQKYFQVFLGTRLLRGEAESTSLNRLAMSVHALMATCQNPRDFHGTDLTDLIQKQVERLHRRNRDDRTRPRTVSVNPLVYLSLCLADRDLTQFEEHDLTTRLSAYATPDEYARDMLSLSISAFACHLRRQESRDLENQRTMHSLLSNATTKLLGRMKNDGSFGSVYSTALAAQALLSLNDTKHWNPESTFDFLKQQQKGDGSFGDFLATYLALPVLSGRSLLHLRNTQCTPPKSDRDLTPPEILEFSGSKHHVRYSLYIGYPKVSGYSIEVLVPRGISFFDIMRVAEHENDLFKFSYEEKNGGIYVYSVSNVPNDSEQGFEWTLYAKRSSDLEVNKLNAQERILGDIREYYPRSDQHVIFWYHPSSIRT